MKTPTTDRAAYHAEWYRKNRERIRADQRARRFANRRVLAAMKLELGCVDCGYREHHEALDWYHRPGTDKKFSLAHDNGRSLSLLLHEAEKCDVRCANCHRIVTARRRAS